MRAGRYGASGGYIVRAGRYIERAGTLAAIRQIIESQGFIINDTKTHLTPMSQKPEVTGLVLMPPKLDVSRTFLKDLKRDIKLWHWLLLEENLLRGFGTDKLMDKLRLSIMVGKTQVKYDLHM